MWIWSNKIYVEFVVGIYSHSQNIISTGIAQVREGRGGEGVQFSFIQLMFRKRDCASTEYSLLVNDNDFYHYYYNMIFILRIITLHI